MKVVNEVIITEVSFVYSFGCLDRKRTYRREIIRILHKCEVLLFKSVPRVTVWHHVAPPSDAKL